MACRNLAKGAAAAEDIRSTTGKSPERIVEVDVSSRGAADDGARRILERLDRIDVLVNNAGAFFPERGTNEDGYERTLVTNCLGPLQLTIRLIPLLRKSSRGGRIVNVGSEAAFFSVPDLEDLDMACGYGRLGFDAYARSKAAQVVGMAVLAERLSEEGTIPAVTVHPGHVSTNIWPVHAWHYRLLSWIQTRFAISAAQAAADISPLLWRPLSELETGGFYSKGAVKELPAALQEPAFRDSLWRVSLERMGLGEDKSLLGEPVNVPQT
uniref:Protochlorophyllide reductase n=1 Tax=Odontella aurita TaxID=265563 RepID=A0A7S4ILX8_9STRA